MLNVIQDPFHQYLSIKYVYNFATGIIIKDFSNNWNWKFG